MPYIRSEHHLDAPLCNCYYDADFENYSWSVFVAKEGTGLKISCPMCEVKLEIPQKSFRARFVIKADESKKKYNKAVKKQEKEEERVPVLKLLEFPVNSIDIEK